MPPPKDQAFILGDGWTSERAARHLLRTYRISEKAWSKPSRGGVTVKHKDIDEVFKAWDPFIFSPPAYLLHLDPRPGTNRLVDARAISRRVTIIIKTYLEDEVQGASFNPLPNPIGYLLLSIWSRPRTLLVINTGGLHLQELVRCPRRPP